MTAKQKAAIKMVLIGMVKKAGLPDSWITPYLERIVKIVEADNEKDSG